MKKTFLLSALATLVFSNTAIASKREEVAQLRLDTYSQEELAMEVHGMPYGDFLQGIVVREQFASIEGAQIIYTGGEVTITQVCDSIQIGNWCVNLPATAAGIELIEIPAGYLLAVNEGSGKSGTIVVVPVDPTQPIEIIPKDPTVPTQPEFGIDPIDVIVEPITPDLGVTPIDVVIQPLDPELGVNPIEPGNPNENWTPTPEVLAALNKWVDENDDKNGETKWDIVWNGEKLVWQDPATGKEKDLRDSSRIQEAFKNTIEAREARRAERQEERRNERQADRQDDRIQPTPKEDLGEFDPKRGLDPRDKAGYEELSELGWNQERIQEMHDILEKQGEYKDDSNAERNEAMQALMQELQQEIAAMPRHQQIQAFVALNSITVSQKYDSVLDQLVNSWGMGTKEQKDKFNAFNDLSNAQKKDKVRTAIKNKASHRRNDNKNSERRERIKRALKSKGYDGSRAKNKMKS